MIAALLAVALAQTAVDEGTFVVRQDTVEVARESFRLIHGRLQRGGIGWTLATTVRYDRARPVIVLAPIVEITTDTLPATLQYDVADPREPSRILGELGRGRFTVRIVSRTTERAREFPANGRPVVLDDSVFALYTVVAWRAAAQPVTLTAIVPRGLRRDTVQVQEVDATGSGGGGGGGLPAPPGALRHVTVTGGPNGVVHLWLDGAGHLLRVEIPARRLSAERIPSG